MIIKEIYLDKVHLGGTARSIEDVQYLYGLGLQFAEIPISDPSTFLDRIKVYKETKDKLGLYYLCHGPREGDPNDVRALEREYLPKVFSILPIMNMLDMALLTLHLWLDQRFVRQEVVDFKIVLLRKIIQRAEDLAITICLENLSENIYHFATPFHDLPQLNMTLDLGHAQLLTDRNVSRDFISHYPHRIKHIHLHDNRGGKSYRDDIHLPPGQGIIDFKNIFKDLESIGYHRTITLELKPPEIASCLDSVKKLLRDW